MDAFTGILGRAGPVVLEDFEAMLVLVCPACRERSKDRASKSHAGLILPRGAADDGKRL